MVDGRKTAGERQRRQARLRARRRVRRGASVLGAVALAFVGVVVPATTASAVSWGISKQVTSGPGPYEPGQNVTYSIQISCSDPNDAPCVGTTMTDPLPDELILVDATISSGDGQISTDGNTVTYTDDTSPNGAQALITVTAQVDPDLPYSANGVDIPNTATIDADNTEPADSTAVITPVVELNLDSETAKTIDPEGALAEPGTPATMTISGTNTSNAPVDTLVVQDPVDPTADPNPFTYLEYAGTGEIDMPPNATEVTEEYWDGDSWEPLDDSVDPADVQGVRYTFSGDIQPGSTATIPVNVQQSEAVTDLTDPTTITNDTSSYVTLDDAESDPVEAEDTYVITPPNTSVTASKSFNPAEVSAGDPTTVTIGAENTGTPVDTLTITEPAPDAESNPFTGDDPITFTGFGPEGDGTGVQWPDGATAATVSFTCADGSSPSEETTETGTLPNPPADCVVEGFTVEFTGSISNGAEASIPFTADTDPDQVPDNVDHPNEIEADVPSADPAFADDTLTTLVDRLATDIDKVITPADFPAVPGQSVVVQLPSELLPFGPDGSTTDADTFVVQEPENPAAPGEFWANFEATGVRSTSVPANATLTVEYWDGDSWEPAPDCPATHGPATVDCDLPDGAEGVRFVYTADEGDGFPPGTEFQPNFTADYTGPTDRDEPISNCASSAAAGGSVEMTDPVQACTTVDPFPVDGDGTGADFMDKTMLGDPATVRARTDDQVTAQMTWSTGGFSGVDPMVVSDIADPENTAIEDSFYDAFNLVAVPAIDGSLDPMIEYDAIAGVELYDGTGWVQATNSTCTADAPCDGGMPAVALTAAEQESTIGVRIRYTESSQRPATSDDPTAPLAGDGVARSTQSDGRHLDLTFQVRDYKRSNPDEAVLGATNGTMYNTETAGVVNDTARGTATYNDNTYTDDDADTAEILDVPLNVTVDKGWTGGPVSVPPEDTPAEFYPSTTVTIEGTNNSDAKVEELRLADPGVEDSDDVQTEDGTKPFDAFTLTGIDLTPPAGTETTTVTLHYDDDTTDTFTEEEAEDLAPEDLVDVVGVEVAYDGLVEPGASGTLDLTLQLRETDRYTDAPITVADYNPVPNGAVATIDDPGGTGADIRQAFDDATMELQDAAIDLNVAKAFNPDTIVEPNHGTGADGETPVIMTLTGQPLGPSRSVEMVLTDDDPQFWNQYDFVDIDPSAVLATPIDQVQVDVFTGGTFEGEPGSADPVTVTGGDWVEGTPSSTFTLPPGVDPEDVQGLRFTFSRADGDIWENPATPTQTVPIQILRRDEMRSGGDVQHDLASNPAAPGETDPGVASNTVDGTTTGADLVVDPGTGDLVPVSADDSADASMLYQHATNGVTIEKDFADTVTGGTQAPDATFPMNITVTNTGDRPITDPVITDPMPQDDEGPQLTLAEDADEPFSYALGGVDDPDPDTPDLPTDAADVTVDQTGDIESLEFTFPEGSVLEVGQSYTITVMVNFRFALPPQTPVENTAGVTGDRPWDECSPRLDDETGQCQADADVRPTGTAVLQQSKVVKATDDDELDVIVDPDYTGTPPDECTPDDAGFYAYPCTPVIAPGHDETWRVEVDNVGNLPMNKVVLYDRLPTPGDVGSFEPTERGSAWEPILTNDPPPEFVDLPEGAEATFYYSTTQDYCMDDIEDPQNEPICPTDDPESGWVELTGDESDDVFQSITALKAVVTYPEDNLFQPGDALLLEGTTTTPPESPEAGDRSIAWNSAAASGVVVAPQGDFNLLPTEGVKVGVATASGPLEVRKFLTGDGQEYAPDSFEVVVQCTSAVGTWVETELDPITITVSPGEPVTVPNLPYDAECTLTEDDSAGQTDFTVTPESVTITREGEPPSQIAITNEYDLGSLELSKSVESDAVDQDGNPIAYGPFEATVECTFLGEDVYAEGYDADTPMVVELDPDGTPVELTGLPVNADCTVTETGTGGAASTSLVVTQPGQDPETIDGPSADIVVVPDEDGTAGTVVDVTNMFDVGAVHLTKVRDGDGADEFGDGPFAFDVVCTADLDGDGPGEATTVYDGSLTLDADNEYEATIENLAAGAECTFTETDDGGATSTVINPNPVTVAAGETAEVTATNTFDLGSVAVEKVVDGDGAELWGAGPFTVEIACTYQGEDVTPDPSSQTFVGGETVTFGGIPIGSECDVTETDDGGATSSDVSPASVVVGGEDGTTEPVEVTATNTFDVGSVVVDKVVDGDGAQYGTGPFEVTLACTYEGEDIEIPGGATREVTPGTPVSFDDLPIGAECTVTEPTDGGATSVDIAPESVTVGGEDGTETEVDVTVTNTFELGSIQVEKDLAGLGALYGPGPFEMQLACIFQDEDIEIPGGATRTINAGETVTYDDLPVGADCTLTETDTFGASSTSISVDGGEPVEFGPEEEPTVDVVVPQPEDGTSTTTVTVTNTFLTSPVVVRKVVDGDGAGFAPPMPDFEPFPGLPDPLPSTPEELVAALQDVQDWLAQVPFEEFPYEVSMVCTTSEGEDVPIPGDATRRFGPGFPGLYFGIPDGATCTVTETDDGGATSVAVAPDSVIVDGEAPITDPEVLTVTNTYDVGEFTVEKAVDGEGAEAYGDGPFEVTARCTFEGNNIAIPDNATRTVSPDEPAVYSGLPVGADCVVSESEDGDATSTTVTTTVDGGEPGEVVVPASGDETVSLLVTNTFDLGELTVEKVVNGDGAEAWGDGPFEVTLACTFDGEEIEIPGGATQTIAGGESVTYTDLPVGAECVVTETDAAGATSSTVSTTVDGGEPGQVVVPATDADPALITVTNTFDVGSLAVDKVVDFEGDAYDVGPFEVTLACTFQGGDIEIPGGAAREIAAGDTVTYDGLPIGAECVVTETDDGGAASSTVSAVGDGDPGAVTIAADPASVTVTNTFDAVPPPPAGGGDGDTGGGGWLPTTGADIALWVGLAVLLVAGGVILVGIRRRQQH